jgi:hypothetical protein
MKLKNTFARRTLSNAATLLSGIALGVIFTLVAKSQFEFDWKVNVVNLLTLLLTFVITFHLGQALTHRASDDRVEKGMLITQAQAIMARLAKERIRRNNRRRGETYLERVQSAQQ